MSKTSHSRRFVSLISSVSVIAGSLTAIAATTVAFPSAAQAVDRITQQTGFNARAWTVTSPDSTGTRYVGGDFTHYKAWDTGIGAVVDAATGAVDASFPKVSGWPYADVVVPDGSGGWFIGGGIGNVGGSGVSRVAHLNSDGSLDTSWTPSVSGGQGVWAMARAGNTVFIGGDFSSVNGVTRTRLAALDATTGALLDWAPVANSTVHTMTVHGDTLYIGGQFTSLAGQSRNLAGAIRLDARTTPATGTCLDAWDDTDCLTGWNPNVGGWGVKAIVTDGTDVWLGGAVSSIGGQSRGSLGKVDAVTGAVDPWNPALNSENESLALDGTTLYVGGLFTSASGETRNRLAAYDTTTDTLTAWDPDVSGNTVKSIAVVGTTVYVGGRFTRVGTEARNHAAAISTSGVVESWDPHMCNQGNGAQSYVYGLAVSSGKVYMIGDFPCAGGMKRLGAAAVGPDGILTSWAPELNGPAFSFSRLGDTIYMAGSFTSINGTSRQWAGAVDTSGAVAAWNPTPGGDRATDVIATANGVYLSGFFATIGGTARRGVALVDTATGALDLAFDAQVSSAVRAMWLDGNRLFIGGDFNSVGGATHEYVAVVDATTGAVDAGFTASTGNTGTIWPFVESIVVVGDRTYLGGEFGTVNGQARRYLAAVDSTTGNLDDSWVGTASAAVYALAVSPDGSTVFAGGNGSGFSSGSGTATGIGEFDAVTGELTPWRANTGEVRGISTSDAAVFIAGSFGTVGGQGRQNTAAVDVDGNVLDPWPMDPATSTPLTVAVTGDATGAVVSAPGGINCGASCEYAYTTGASVTLTAVPAAGATFRGWTGDCTGSGTTCTVSVATARSATAEFSSGSTPGGGGSGSGDSEPAAPVFAPSSPEKVVAVAGDERIAVSWSASESVGSFPVTTYQAIAQPGGATCLTAETACELNGLANGTEYSISIRALNGAGWSAYSAPVSATPLALDPSSVQITALPRVADGRHDRIRISGQVQGLAEGVILRPYLQMSGNRVKMLGKARVAVTSEGTISWQRKIRPNRNVTVYFEVDGVASNSVTWQRIR